MTGYENDPNGYAAYVAGIKLVCSDAMGEWTGQKGIGTMPHALIIMHEMDLISAATDFHKAFPNDNLIVLVVDPKVTVTVYPTVVATVG